jgi:hypothetical protein
MKAKKFDQQFEDGADITAFLDLSKARRVQQAQKQVSLPFSGESDDGQMSFNKGHWACVVLPCS